MQKVLRDKGFKVHVIFGGEMSREEREKTIKSFRDLETHVLITTNVLSRGIDIPEIKLVINFDVPFKIITKSSGGGAAKTER